MGAEEDPKGVEAPPPAGGPDEATIKGWIREALEEAGEGDPEVEPTPAKATTAREREAIAEAAARKAVEAIKRADPPQDKAEPAKPPVEPVRRTGLLGRLRAGADKFWGIVAEEEGK